MEWKNYSLNYKLVIRLLQSFCDQCPVEHYSTSFSVCRIRRRRWGQHGINVIKCFTEDWKISIGPKNLSFAPLLFHVVDTKDRPLAIKNYPPPSEHRPVVFGLCWRGSAVVGVGHLSSFVINWIHSRRNEINHVQLISCCCWTNATTRVDCRRTVDARSCCAVWMKIAIRYLTPCRGQSVTTIQCMDYYLLMWFTVNFMVICQFEL